MTIEQQSNPMVRDLYKKNTTPQKLNMKSSLLIRSDINQYSSLSKASKLSDKVLTRLNNFNSRIENIVTKQQKCRELNKRYELEKKLRMEQQDFTYRQEQLFRKKKDPSGSNL